MRPGSLTELYRAAGGVTPDSGAQPFEQTVAEMYARAQSAHPDIAVRIEDFVAHLARCGASVSADMSHSNVEDLYLACAALAGSPIASQLIREICAPAIERSLRRISKTHSIAEDVAQRLWDTLFVGAGDGPTLAAYAGRGPVASWVAVSALRMALMTLRHERAEIRARQEAAVQHRLVTSDPEMAAIKDRYREQFQRAVEGAFEALDARDKMIYSMHFVDGLTLERIGAAYGVHHTTVIRWLRGARQKVIEGSKERLRETVPLDSGEFESLARLMISQIDLDPSRMLMRR